MIDPQQNKNIPCFYHIPKSAGTYAISLIFLHFRLFRLSQTNWLSLKKETTRNIVIRHNNKEIARIIGGDPNFICNESSIFKPGDDDTHYTINLNECSPDLFVNLNVFSIIIEPGGFRYHDQIFWFLDDIFESKKSFKKFNFINFMILREPIKRAISFFDYINSDKSKHEPTHGIIPNKFSEYAKSQYTEDSWLIRQFTNVDNSTGITRGNYNAALNILKTFKLCDIKDTDSFVRNIFKESLNVNLTQQYMQANGWSTTRNSKSTNPTVIDEESRKILQERMKYEIDLYNKLLKT